MDCRQKLENLSLLVQVFMLLCLCKDVGLSSNCATESCVSNSPSSFTVHVTANEIYEFVESDAAHEPQPTKLRLLAPRGFVTSRVDL